MFYTVDSVELYLTTGNNFNILVGDGTNWSPLNNTLQSTAPYAAPGSPAHVYSWYTVSPDNNVSGQFLRYEVVGGGHWAHLGEIEISGTLSAVPVPAAAWLFGSALIGLVGIARRKKV